MIMTTRNEPATEYIPERRISIAGWKYLYRCDIAVRFASRKAAVRITVGVAAAPIVKINGRRGTINFGGAASSQPKSQHTKPMILHQPWRPSPPHMTTFPWSYGSDNTPAEMKSLLFLIYATAHFFLPLDLRRRVAYVAAHNTAIFDDNIGGTERYRCNDGGTIFPRGG